MHAPEVAPRTGCFGRFSRQGCVGVDIRQRPVPPHETQLPSNRWSSSRTTGAAAPQCGHS